MPSVKVVFYWALYSLILLTYPTFPVLWIVLGIRVDGPTGVMGLGILLESMMKAVLCTLLSVPVYILFWRGNLTGISP